MLKSLETEREMQDLVFQETTTYLHESLNLLDEVENAYNALNELFSSCDKLDDEWLALASLQLLTRSELRSAVMALLRGYSSDSLGAIRKAIECTLFAAWLFEVPDGAKKWLAAQKDAEAYDAYREDFKLMKIIEAKKHKRLSEIDQRVVSDLRKIYDICCDHVHPTSALLSQRLLVDKSEHPPKILLHPYDKYRGPQYALQFFLIMDTHVQLLYLYGVLLSLKCTSVKLPEWIATLAPVFDAIHGQRANWQSRTVQVQRVTPFDRFNVIKPGEKT